ncbi:MAG: PASTA domain-containing protein [Bacilli bacterium]|nr:PASTA domain-containing protein [Bacilli bacterium]
MKEVNKKNKITLLVSILYGVALLLSIGYLIYNIIKGDNQTNHLYLIINSLLLVIIIILYGMLGYANTNKLRQVLATLTSVCFIALVSFNLLVNIGVIKLPTADTIPDFSNKSINDAISWASDNKIEVEQMYEYSDNVEEFNIITQNILPNTLLKDVKKINFTVSNGPNYDKLVVIANMVSWNIDDALKVVEENFLNNVEINYIINDEIEKDIIISQSINGQMKRNDKLILNVSLGIKDDLVPVVMIDLKNKSLFESTLWLKRNGINYKLEYEFSDIIKRHNVISQSELKDTMIDPSSDSITLIVSKGKKINIPDLNSMAADDITRWIVDNKLRVEYSDEYHKDIAIGKLISSNYKFNDEVEEETVIKLIISKGQLRMPKLTSLSEFRQWAGKYNIVTEEIFEYNNVKKGEIIKFSHKENDVITPSDKVIIYISNGSPITIPNFIGKSKDTIRTECNRIGLNCTFYYSGYSSSKRDIALSQNKRSGSQVISGTNVSIGLSSGIASTFKVEITESLLSIGSSSGTITSLKTWFNSQYPNVTFTFITKKSNTFDNSGFIHESSPTKDGTSVTQGKTYQVWITE